MADVPATGRDRVTPTGAGCDQHGAVARAMVAERPWRADEGIRVWQKTLTGTPCKLPEGKGAISVVRDPVETACAESVTGVISPRAAAPRRLVDSGPTCAINFAGNLPDIP